MLKGIQNRSQKIDNHNCNNKTNPDFRFTCNSLPGCKGKSRLVVFIPCFSDFRSLSPFSTKHSRNFLDSGPRKFGNIINNPFAGIIICSVENEGDFF